MWPLLIGLLLERQILSDSSSTSNSLPVLFSLLHPLEEIKPFSYYSTKPKEPPTKPPSQLSSSSFFLSPIPPKPTNHAQPLPPLSSNPNFADLNLRSEFHLQNESFNNDSIFETSLNQSFNQSTTDIKHSEIYLTTDNEEEEEFVNDSHSKVIFSSDEMPIIVTFSHRTKKLTFWLLRKKENPLNQKTYEKAQQLALLRAQFAKSQKKKCLSDYIDDDNNNINIDNTINKSNNLINEGEESKTNLTSMEIEDSFFIYLDSDTLIQAELYIDWLYEEEIPICPTIPAFKANDEEGVDCICIHIPRPENVLIVYKIEKKLLDYSLSGDFNNTNNINSFFSSNYHQYQVKFAFRINDILTAIPISILNQYYDKNDNNHHNNNDNNEEKKSNILVLTKRKEILVYNGAHSILKCAFSNLTKDLISKGGKDRFPNMISSIRDPVNNRFFNCYDEWINLSILFSCSSNFSNV